VLKEYGEDITFMRKVKAKFFRVKANPKKTEQVSLIEFIRKKL